MSADAVKTKAMSKRAVILYTASLFVFVVIFIVLSYLIDARGDSAVAALSEQNTTALQKIESLHSENERLQAENESLSESVAALEEELRQLYKDKLEETSRLEDRYKAQYDELLSRHNELLEQLETNED